MSPMLPPDIHLGFRGCRAEDLLPGQDRVRVIRASPLLESLGNRAYALVLRLNRYTNAVRRRLGYPTALVEDFDGRLSLLRWTEQAQHIDASAENGPAPHRMRDALAA